MSEIPLFPLNTVLFPGMPLRLHIFEGRYKQMIRECLDTGQSFGVVLIRKGQEALGPLAEPHDIGCSAQIVQEQVLDEGRYNLTVVGSERFKILALERSSAPYLIGTIEPFPLTNRDPLAFEQFEVQLRRRVRRYLRLLTRLGRGQIDELLLPKDDPALLLYIAAIMLQAPMPVKQELLAVEDALDLARLLDAVYRREEAFLKAMIAGEKEAPQSPFSIN